MSTIAARAARRHAACQGAARGGTRWGRWSDAVAWSNVRLIDVSGDGRADLIGRTDTGQWWIGESTGMTFQNHRLADLSAAWDSLGRQQENTRDRASAAEIDQLLDLIALDVAAQRGRDL